MASASLSPDRRQAAYRNDVRDLTLAPGRAGGRFETFQRRPGDLARRHAISDWEDEPVTYEGIGLGLGKGRVPAGEGERYASRIEHVEPARLADPLVGR